MGTHSVSSIDTEDYDLLIDALRGAREAAGIGQETLARRLGKSKTYIYKIEEKRRRLDVVEFTLVVEAMALDPLEILSAWLLARKSSTNRPRHP